MLDDGGETDLDLGNYERFLNISVRGRPVSFFKFPRTRPYTFLLLGRLCIAPHACLLPLASTSLCVCERERESLMLVLLSASYVCLCLFSLSLSLSLPLSLFLSIYASKSRFLISSSHFPFLGSILILHCLIPPPIRAYSSSPSILCRSL